VIGPQGPLLLVFRLVSISSRSTHIHTHTLARPHSPCQSRPPSLSPSSPLSLARLCLHTLTLTICPSNPMPVTPSHTQLTNEPLNRPPFESANTPKFDCFCSVSACTSSSSSPPSPCQRPLCSAADPRAHQALATRAEPISALKPSARVR
jgi:hypothetical protein